MLKSNASLIVPGQPLPARHCQLLLPDRALVHKTLRDLQAKAVTLDLHAEALGSADVDVVLRQIHAVASFVRAQRFDGREDRGHARLVLDLLKQLLADQKGLDASCTICIIARGIMKAAFWMSNAPEMRDGSRLWFRSGVSRYSAS